MSIKKITILLFTCMILMIPLESADEKKPCRDIPLVMLEQIIIEEMELHKTFEVTTFPRTVELKSPRAGTLTAVKVAPGDIISENWEVGIIDNALADRIQTLEKNLERWKRTLKQRENWAERSAAAEDQAQRNIEELETELAETRQAAEEYRIQSPLSGTVTEIRVAEGDALKEGSVVAVIQNAKAMLFQAPLSLDERQTLRPGDELTVTLVRDNTVATARVEEITEDGVLFRIDNSDQLITEGTAVSLKILTDRDPEAEFISPGMILKDDQGSYVFVPEYYPETIQAKKLYLVLGPEAEGRVWVKEGLDGVDAVIKTALHCLSDGKVIQVLYRDPVKGKMHLLKNQEDAAEFMKAVPAGEEPVETVTGEEIPEEKPVTEEEPGEKVKKKKKKKIRPEKPEPVVKEKEKFAIVPFLQNRKKKLRYFNFSRDILDEDRVQVQLTGKDLNIKKLKKIIEKFKYEKFCIEKSDGVQTFYAVVFKGVTPELIQLRRGFVSRLGVYLFGGGQFSRDEVLQERLGDIQIRFGLSIDADLIEGFGVFAGYTNQTNSGEMSFEGTTTFANHIISVGPRYNFKRYFVKGGLAYILFQEKNDAYTFSDSLLGFYLGGGARLLIKENPLKFIRSLHAMLEVGYLGAVYKPEEAGVREISFSGFTANAGLFIKL